MHEVTLENTGLVIPRVLSESRLRASPSNSTLKVCKMGTTTELDVMWDLTLSTRSSTRELTSYTV